ncbi:unnamed protein product [Adineta ricciae]|nr:unnamed protein product [Adineta ricciae]
MTSIESLFEMDFNMFDNNDPFVVSTGSEAIFNLRSNTNTDGVEMTMESALQRLDSYLMDEQNNAISSISRQNICVDNETLDDINLLDLSSEVENPLVDLILDDLLQTDQSVTNHTNSISNTDIASQPLLTRHVEETDTTQPHTNTIDSNITQPEVSTSNISKNARITEHDRPHSEYGHMSIEDIAHVFKFDLEGKQTNKKRKESNCRMRTQTFSILCHTEMSKNDLMNFIKKEFSMKKLRYVCIGTHLKTDITKHETYIQILLTKQINKCVWFLDKVTGKEITFKDYEFVNRNTSQFIKDPLRQININSINTVNFNLNCANNLCQTENSNNSNETNSVNDDINNDVSNEINTASVITTTIATNEHDSNSSTSEYISTVQPIRRVLNYEDVISKQAKILAKHSVTAAMRHMEQHLDHLFLLNHKNYLEGFKYIYELANKINQ